MPVTQVDESKPEVVLEADDLFEPRAVLTYVSVWIVGPSMSTALASGCFVVPLL